MGTAAQFIREIEVEFNAAQEELRTIIARIALDAVRRIVLRTPVDKGRARGNWFAQIGSAGTEISESFDPTGSAAIQRANGALSAYRAYDGFPVISIYNNLPYINALEHGHSDQAPAGMVSITAAELATQ